MAEPPSLTPSSENSADLLAERQASTNLAAFFHWLRAVHGLRLEPRDSRAEAFRSRALASLRSWAEAEPGTAAVMIRRFAGKNFGAANLAAGVLLQADLRPDDRILVLAEGEGPDWLPQVLVATQGRAVTPGEATVVICDRLPEILPPRTRRLILIGKPAMETVLSDDITVSHAADWTWPAAPTPTNPAPIEECARPPCGPPPRLGASG